MPTPAFKLARTARDAHLDPSEEQDQLSQQWLLPALPELIEITRRHRAQFDAEFLERICQHPPPAGNAGEEPHEYPLGCCEIIRDAVWKRLGPEPLVVRLRAQGLLWKKVFFIQHGLYFQNGIQCGGYLLDAANDTVFRQKNPVVCESLHAFRHERIDDWLRYAEVAESYLKIRLVPNRYFPLVLPFAPFLAVSPSGRMQILVHQDFLFRLDLGEHWKRLQALLASAWWRDRGLDSVEEAALAALCSKSPDLPIGFAPCPDKALRRRLQEWDQFLNLPAEEFARVFQKLTELTRTTARMLYESELRATRAGPRKT